MPFISLSSAALRVYIWLCAMEDNHPVSWSPAPKGGGTVSACLLLAPGAGSPREDCESSTEHANSYCKSIIILGSLADNIVASMCFLGRSESRSILKIKSQKQSLNGDFFFIPQPNMEDVFGEPT